MDPETHRIVGPCTCYCYLHYCYSVFLLPGECWALWTTCEPVGNVCLGTSPIVIILRELSVPGVGAGGTRGAPVRGSTVLHWVLWVFMTQQGAGKGSCHLVHQDQGANPATHWADTHWSPVKACHSQLKRPPQCCTPLSELLLCAV